MVNGLCAAVPSGKTVSQCPIRNMWGPISLLREKRHQKMISRFMRSRDHLYVSSHGAIFSSEMGGDGVRTLAGKRRGVDFHHVGDLFDDFLLSGFKRFSDGGPRRSFYVLSCYKISPLQNLP